MSTVLEGTYRSHKTTYPLSQELCLQSGSSQAALRLYGTRMIAGYDPKRRVRTAPASAFVVSNATLSQQYRADLQRACRGTGTAEILTHVPDSALRHIGRWAYEQRAAVKDEYTSRASLIKTTGCEDIDRSCLTHRCQKSSLNSALDAKRRMERRGLSEGIVAMKKELSILRSRGSPKTKTEMLLNKSDSTPVETQIFRGFGKEFSPGRKTSSKHDGQSTVVKKLKDAMVLARVEELRLSLKTERRRIHNLWKQKVEKSKNRQTEDIYRLHVLRLRNLSRQSHQHWSDLSSVTAEALADIDSEIATKISSFKHERREKTKRT